MKSYEESTGLNQESLRGQKLPKELLASLLERPRRFYEQFTDELSHKQKPTAKEQDLLARGRGHLGNILRILGRTQRPGESMRPRSYFWGR